MKLELNDYLLGIKNFIKGILFILAFILSAAYASPMSEGWLQISAPGSNQGYYYSPLSITKVKDKFYTVQTIINYQSDEGRNESLIGITLYDCFTRKLQEQSTRQYSKFWADGELLYEIGLEATWKPVKIGSDGMRLFNLICNY